MNGSQAPGHDAEPEIRTEEDLLPWAIAHRARMLTLMDQQHRINNDTAKDNGRMDCRIGIVEKQAAKWSAIAAIIGGLVGSGIALLIRYALTAGGTP
jgi:hypothetical protein